ncbi:hypothetical protein V6R21_25805 [Limibacter armeniacum]|uniref:hypothetical protein n=1 Tax=Limibacter armeniacum TaxID=466084 RepID=UPI002FE57491
MKKLATFLICLSTLQAFASTDSNTTSIVSSKDTVSTPDNRTDVFSDEALTDAQSIVTKVIINENLIFTTTYAASDKVILTHNKVMVVLEKEDLGTKISVISGTKKDNKLYNRLALKIWKAFDRE